MSSCKPWSGITANVLCSVSNARLMEGGWRAQLEREKIVTLHLRGRRVGSDRALFDVLRLFTVLHANITATGAYQEHLHDTLLSDEERQRAAKADRLLQAAIEALRGVMVPVCPTGSTSQVGGPPNCCRFNCARGWFCESALA